MSNKLNDSLSPLITEYSYHFTSVVGNFMTIDPNYFMIVITNCSL